MGVMVMSKYTTEVRFICENFAGLSESAGGNNVDGVLEKSWNKVFDSGVKFFDEEYRKVLCKKILKHYYTREIGCETVGLWKLWMNTKLEEIMPYYNQLYESELLKFDPLTDTKIETTGNRSGNSDRDKSGTENTNDKRDISGTSDMNKNVNNSGSSENNTDRSTHGDSVERDLYSDTPQGSLQNVENETYLTNARKVSNDSNGTDNITSNDTFNSNSVDKTTNTNTSNDVFTGKRDSAENESVNSTEDYAESIIGKRGSGSFSDLLNEFRKTFLNIDMMVIDEFEEMFFQLW